MKIRPRLRAHEENEFSTRFFPFDLSIYKNFLIYLFLITNFSFIYFFFSFILSIYLFCRIFHEEKFARLHEQQGALLSHLQHMHWMACGFAAMVCSWWFSGGRFTRRLSFSIIPNYDYDLRAYAYIVRNSTYRRRTINWRR